MHLNAERMPRQKQSWGRSRFLENRKAPWCYFGANYCMISIEISSSFLGKPVLAETRVTTAPFPNKWLRQPLEAAGCSEQTHFPLPAQPTAPVSTTQEHDHIYFLQLRTLTNSSRQQRPVYLYFSLYIFSRMAVTIIETIKKLALTLNKCAHMSGSPRKENLWDRCWIQGRKKSWIALARDAAQDTVANIWFDSLCSFRTRI